GSTTHKMEAEMGFRVTISGVVIECDTPGEALAIARANEGQEPANKQSRQRRGRNADAGINDTPRQFLTLLKEAYPQSLRVDELASKLGKVSKSLPPTI